LQVGDRVLAPLKRKIWLRVLGLESRPDDGQFHDFENLVRNNTRHAEALRASPYMDFPNFVHIETLALCNAACEFCPYPAMTRRGTRMPDELIRKVLRDLGDGPKDLKFLIAPYKVSEPFLEPRLFDIMTWIADGLPNARLALITNGSPLTERKIERLARFRNIAYLSVSLNFDNADEYETVMRIPFARTLKRLDALHERYRAGEIPFPVRVARVACGRDADWKFVDFVRQRYPLFKTRVAPRNDWIGEVITPGANARVPDAPCHRWFDMSIVATGEVAMCCMDGEARYSKGNVARQHVLELYNQPHLRRLRENLISRRAAPAPCSRCTYVTG
jgi:sulfatase maturation enzyme AslB (radical SAM superfamily)